MPHINELIDWTVDVFVVHKNKVLLRLHDKYDIWLSVGGHVELEENPNEAAVREVKEETGLDVVICDKLLPFQEKTDRYQELIPPFFMNIHKISETHQHISMIYFASAKSDEILESVQEKSGGCKWMTREDIVAATDIDKTVKHYALKALEELGNAST
jgi:ADP-ribose pyrophosphatase YjhB (NUDIX family)